jgi:hypothetical protein
LKSKDKKKKATTTIKSAGKIKNINARKPKNITIKMMVMSSEV